MVNNMNSEKQWIFSRIAFYFAIAFPLIMLILKLLHVLLLRRMYGTEILDAYSARILPFFKIAIIVPLAYSLLIFILSRILKKTEKDKETSLNALAISILAVYFTSIIYVNLFAKTRVPHCLSNIKQLNYALRLYADDYDSHLPPLKSNWNSTLEVYTKNNRLLHCPSVITSKDPTYAYNKNIAGLDINKIKNPNETFSIFESKPGKNLIGTSELLPKYPRHDVDDNYAFLDGRAKWIKRDGLDASMFQPDIEKSK